MTPEDELSTHSSVRFHDLHRFSSLFQAYCEDYPSLAEFFAGDFRDPSVLRESASRAAAHPRDRETLVTVLRRQNEQWGAREHTLRNIERLRDPKAVAVVTGQQVGLLTGPLYTILKTITAVQVARELESDSGIPHIPVFWLEGEDHDVAESTSIALPGDDGTMRFSYVPPHETDGLNAGPVGRLRIGEDFGAFLSDLEAALPGTEFRDGVIGAIAASYEKGETLVGGFARYLRTMFPDDGLVFLSPDDAELKSLLTPLFRKEMEDPDGSFAALHAASDRISGEYFAQIHAKPGNLFLIHEQGRVRLEPSEGGFHLRGLDFELGADEAVELVTSSPDQFSANVALRPLAQDTLLPTAVYVAGPGEVAYFAQLKGLYAWAGIPMPVIFPRASVTFVEKRIQRVLDRYAMSIPQLSGDVNEVLRDIVLSNMDVDVEKLFGTAEAEIGAAMDRIKPSIEAIDTTLGSTVDATLTGLVKQLQGLKGRAIRSAKRQQEQIQEAVGRAANQLFPDGNLQERTVSPIYFMTKYGPDLPLRWLDQITTETTRHQIHEVSGAGS